MRKAVIYVRVASGEDASVRISAQLECCRQYARVQRLTVVREFREVGTRKQALAMLAFVKQNSNCRVVIAEKLDRLSRNLHDFVALEELVEQLGAEIHFAKEALVYNKQASSVQKQIYRMWALFNEHYNDALQEKIRNRR